MVLCGVGVVVLSQRIAALPDARGEVGAYLWLWTAWFGFLVLGGWAMRRVAVPSAVVWLLTVAVAARVCMVVMPASLSDDWLRYLWDGRLLVSGLDPYAHVPSDPALRAMHDDVLLPGMNSPDYFTVYPPVSQGVFALSWWMGGGDPGRALLAMRAIFAASDALACVLLVAWLRGLRIDPRRAVWYAWNPVAVVELVGGSHSEALLAAPLMGYLLAVHARRDAVAGGLLAVAVWVKLFPILAVVPLALRVGRRGSLRAGLACSIVGVLIGWPMLRWEAARNVLDSLGLYAGVFSFNHGPFLLLWSVLERVWPEGLTFLGGPYEVATRLMLLGFAGWVGWQWWRGRALHEAADADRRLAGILAAIFGGYVVANANVHPWSLVWVLPLVPALGGRWIAAWTWFSFWAGWSYGAYDLEPIGVPTWLLIVEWGGFIALAGWAGWPRRSGRERPASPQTNVI